MKKQRPFIWSLLFFKSAPFRVTGTHVGNHNHWIAGVVEVPAGDKTWNWLIPQDDLDQNDAIGEDDQNP